MPNSIRHPDVTVKKCDLKVNSKIKKRATLDSVVYLKHNITPATRCHRKERLETEEGIGKGNEQMIHLIVKIIVLPLLAFYALFSVLMPLSESHCIEGAESLICLNFAFCLVLYMIYALPFRPSGWRWNFYLPTDLLLLAELGFLWILSTGGRLPEAMHSEVAIVAIGATVLLAVAIAVVAIHLWAFRCQIPETDN